MHIPKLPFLRTPDTNLERKYSGKIFCVGFNKTGTTSVAQVLSDFGYLVGNQAAAEMLLGDWHKEHYDLIIRYCSSAQAFQDIPFSLPRTYSVLDEAFPDAKFILTVRDSEEQWFSSLVKFHTKLFSSDPARPPTEQDLANSVYRYRGFTLDAMKAVYGYPDVGLYDADFYKNLYRGHIEQVTRHFKGTSRLLVLNVSDQNAYRSLAQFLAIDVSKDHVFPWKNKT